jgi:hypothetical protein
LPGYSVKVWLVRGTQVELESLPALRKQSLESGETKVSRVFRARDQRVEMCIEKEFQKFTEVSLETSAE